MVRVVGVGEGCQNRLEEVDVRMMRMLGRMRNLRKQGESLGVLGHEYFQVCSSVIVLSE